MLTQQSRLRWAITFPIAPRLIDALSAVRAPLLFAVRMWASVCLALFVAFWLELDNPYWAGTSAAIVCYPQLGASLRKGWFRMIGTVVGATMIVVLSSVLLTYAIAANRARKLFRSSRAMKIINRGAAGVMAGAALTIAAR